jgi:hypothetical protein
MPIIKETFSIRNSYLNGDRKHFYIIRDKVEKKQSCYCFNQ